MWMCDTKLAWVKNLPPCNSCYSETGILTSSDQVLLPDGNCLEIWLEVSDTYDIGISHWGPNTTQTSILQLITILQNKMFSSAPLIMTGILKFH